MYDSSDITNLLVLRALHFEIGRGSFKGKSPGSKVEIILQGSYPFSETNFQDFSRTQIDISRALKLTLTPTIPRSQS